MNSRGYLGILQSQLPRGLPNQAEPQAQATQRKVWGPQFRGRCRRLCCLLLTEPCSGKGISVSRERKRHSGAGPVCGFRKERWCRLKFSEGASTLCMAGDPGGRVCPISPGVSQAPLEFPVALHPIVIFQVLVPRAPAQAAHVATACVRICFPHRTDSGHPEGRGRMVPSQTTQAERRQAAGDQGPFTELNLTLSFVCYFERKKKKSTENPLSLSVRHDGSPLFRLLPLRLTHLCLFPTC